MFPSIPKECPKEFIATSRHSSPTHTQKHLSPFEFLTAPQNGFIIEMLGSLVVFSEEANLISDEMLDVEIYESLAPHLKKTKQNSGNLVITSVAEGHTLYPHSFLVSWLLQALHRASFICSIFPPSVPLIFSFLLYIS